MLMILKKPLFVAKQWEFKHTTTSPLYPLANKLMEKSVQTKESANQSKARYLGLLEYRNIPIDDVAHQHNYSWVDKSDQLS